MNVWTMTSADMTLRSTPPAAVSVDVRRYSSSYPATSPAVPKIGCRATQTSAIGDVPPAASADRVVFDGAEALEDFTR